MSEVYKKLQNKAENNHINNSKHQYEMRFLWLLNVCEKHAAILNNIDR